MDPSYATVSFLLAPGDYAPLGGRAISLDAVDDGVASFAKEVRILGACAESTTLRGLDDTALSVDSPSLSVVVARVRASGGAFWVRAASALTVRDSAFEGNGAIDGVSWNATGGSLVVENSRFTNTDTAVLADEADSVDLARNAFAGCGFACVWLKAFEAATIDGCTFHDAANGLVIADRAGGAQPVVVARSWFENMAEQGVAISNASGIEITGSSFKDFALGILVTDASDVALTDVRVVGGLAGVDAAGILANASGDIRLSGVVVGELPGTGITVEGSSSLMIAESVIESCGENGLRTHCSKGDCGAAALTVESTTFRANRVAIDATSGGATIRGCVVGGSAAQGVRLRGVAACSVESNTVASNGSVGIEMANLSGDSSSSYLVRGNEIARNVGIGIQVRSGGAGAVRIEDNTLFGTLGGQVSNTQGSFDVGDGIAVLTGTDGVGSNVALSGNAVDGSYRVGVIADGLGTVLTIEGSVFGPSNGFGRSAIGLNLVAQNLVQLLGSDASSKKDVANMPVANAEVYDMIAIGGSGDPR